MEQRLLNIGFEISLDSLTLPSHPPQKNSLIKKHILGNFLNLWEKTQEFVPQGLKQVVNLPVLLVIKPCLGGWLWAQIRDLKNYKIYSWIKHKSEYSTTFLFLKPYFTLAEAVLGSQLLSYLTVLLCIQLFCFQNQP